MSHKPQFLCSTLHLLHIMIHKILLHSKSLLQHIKHKESVLSPDQLHQYQQAYKNSPQHMQEFLRIQLDLQSLCRSPLCMQAVLHSPRWELVDRSQVRRQGDPHKG